MSEPGSKIATSPKSVILVTKYVGFRNNWTPKKEDHLSGKKCKMDGVLAYAAPSIGNLLLNCFISLKKKTPAKRRGIVTL